MLTLLAVPLLITVLLFRTLCLEPFNIPAGSDGADLDGR